MYLLGIDVGTSAAKAVVFDEAGRAAASADAEYPLYTPRDGWAEQEPLDWWRGVCAASRAAMAKAGVREVAGVGLSGQMHGLVLLDAAGTPLRPAIIWCDQRTKEECGEITSIVGRERLVEITANPALTGFTASKIRWVQKNEPELYAKAAHILLPKDYIRYMLTGELATEVSDASGTQLMNVAAREWSGEILEKLEIDPAMTAKMYESQEITGAVSAFAQRESGIPAGTPVAGGAGDQAACAVGSGIVRGGVVSSTIGTSGVVFACTDRMICDPLGRVHTFCHAIPDTWHVMGVTQGAGLSVSWFRDCFYPSLTYRELDEIAEKIPVGCDGVTYLPYLAGERTPHLDPSARGVFFGLSARHGKEHMLRAVMEGVAFSLADCMEIVRGMGIETGEILLSGGGGKSPLWRQMQADLFGSPVSAASAAEGGALGAAILAGVGTGIYGSVAEACSAVIHARRVAFPLNADAYAKPYAVYKRLYPALKPIFAGEA